MRPRLHGRGEPEHLRGRYGAPHRFNAATATWPWRTRPPTPTGRDGRRASMRPRLHGRGERLPSNSCPHIRHELQCGHGYMAVENELPRAFASNRSAPLQCGHGYMAVENVRATRSPAPPPFRFNAATATWPWRTRLPEVSGNGVGLLQCGHGYMAVENGPSPGSPSCPGRGFNAATATWPWRTRK